MPSVADELAALRAKGSVKAHATNFQGGAALSTPEAEAAALKAQLEHEKLGNTTAKKFLNKGSKGAAQASADQAAQFTAKKKEDLEKKAQALLDLSLVKKMKILKKGATVGGYSQQINEPAPAVPVESIDLEAKNEGAGKAVPQAAVVDKKSSETMPVATEAVPISDVPYATSVAKEKPAPAPVKKKELAPAPVETTDDVPEPAEVEDAIPKLESPRTENVTQQIEQQESDSEDNDKGFNDFLKFLKS
mmetsp:Transcript_32152/g.59383  ORF Transcript_32152/g.59383 Transcript_32152/m.59383 type:complete len:248 (-) Transcript_32152:456-1199(-)